MRKLAMLGTAGAALWIAWSPAVIADSSPSPSAAVASLTVNPGSAAPDAQITISGSGYPAKARIDIYLDSPSHALGLFGASDDHGAFSVSIPILAAPGPHTICADLYASTQSAAVIACAPLAVTDYKPVLVVTPTSGPPRTTVTVTGSGFPPGELVALYIDTPDIFLGTPGPTADNQGNISGGLGYMPGDAGVHQVCGDTGPPWAGNQPVVLKVCTPITVTGTSLPSPSPLPPIQTSPSSPSPSPLAFPPATISATPAAAEVTPAAFPAWPVLVLAAAAIAVGAGIYVWIRRRAGPPWS
ncbi:MAG: hypothetical protein ACHQ0J_08145 [Candidatus Dormibacterales bacterium]